jgi:hypothetical protein
MNTDCKAKKTLSYWTKKLDQPWLANLPIRSKLPFELAQAMCWFKQIVTKPVYLFSFMYPTTDIKKNTMLQADCYQTGLSLLLHVPYHWLKKNTPMLQVEFLEDGRVFCPWTPHLVLKLLSRKASIFYRPHLLSPRKGTYFAQVAEDKDTKLKHASTHASTALSTLSYKRWPSYLLPFRMWSKCEGGWGGSLVPGPNLQLCRGVWRAPQWQELVLGLLSGWEKLPGTTWGAILDPYWGREG